MLKLRIIYIIQRLPFTLLTLAVLFLIAQFTNTHVGDLTRYWMNHMGFAPRDLLGLRLDRLFGSALVTGGKWVFWSAVVMIALATGFSEWVAGTRRAALTFWGVHLFTLIALSLFIAIPLRMLGITLGRAMTVARDVGPSAGYFASLGLAISYLRKPWTWYTGALIWGTLLMAFFIPTIGASQSAAVEFGANIAHAMAFPLGWIAGLIPSHRRFS